MREHNVWFNVNIFGYDERVYPIYISKENYEDHLELLWISDEEKAHYVYIKDFNKLMFSFSNRKKKKHFCMHCLHCFSSEELLEKHCADCIAINGTQAIVMPPEVQRSLSETNRKDYQCLLLFTQILKLSLKISYTEAYQSHRTCGFGYKVICHYDSKYSKPIVIYRGEDAIEKFIKKMMWEVVDCRRATKREFNKELQMTREDEINFQNRKKCHICNEEYKQEEIKTIEYDPEKPINICVRDHCHITGKYRGSAHRDCNLKWRISPENIKIPVIFHNLKSYDSHLIMQK